MTAECSDGRLLPFPLSREQQWVVHAVLLDDVELALGAGSDPRQLACDLGIIEAIEAGDSAFTVRELDHIRHALASHARAFEAAPRDREIAWELLQQLDGLLAGQPT